MSDWNTKIIAEFRANEGRVGGNFEGAPIVLVHHRGRKSGREYINPMMYLPHDTEQDWTVSSLVDRQLILPGSADRRNGYGIDTTSVHR